MITRVPKAVLVACTALSFVTTGLSNESQAGCCGLFSWLFHHQSPSYAYAGYGGGGCCPTQGYSGYGYSSYAPFYSLSYGSSGCCPTNNCCPTGACGASYGPSGCCDSGGCGIGGCGTGRCSTGNCGIGGCATGDCNVNYGTAPTQVAPSQNPPPERPADEVPAGENQQYERQKQDQNGGNGGGGAGDMFDNREEEPAGGVDPASESTTKTFKPLDSLIEDRQPAPLNLPSEGPSTLKPRSFLDGKLTWNSAPEAKRLSTRTSVTAPRVVRQPVKGNDSPLVDTRIVRR